MNGIETNTNEYDYEEKKTTLLDILSSKPVLIGMAIILLLALAYRYICPFHVTRVSGDSMDPTFHDGQLILVDERGSTLDNLKRGDIVVTKKLKTKENRSLIKRIVGVPNETLGFLYNDKENCIEANILELDETGKVLSHTKLNEDYIKEPMNEYLGTYKTHPQNENLITVKEEYKETDHILFECKDNEYVLLGDNRNNSGDSREVGPIHKDEIEGKVICSFKPFTKY